MEGVFSYLRGPGRWLLWTVGLIGSFVLVGWIGWQSVRERVLFSELYQLQREHIFTSPQPEWIRSDVVGEVFRTVVRDRPVYLWEENLCQRLADAFAQHPWVLKVDRVSKSYPARVEVQVQWRRPVCMVFWQEKLLPVDSEGTVLPWGEFSPVEAARYPRLMGIPTPPPTIPGARWRDTRVVEGAQIAAALGPLWNSFHLASLRAVPLAEGLSSETLYELWTHGGSRIIWGLGPSSLRPAEPTPADKIARLQQYIDQHGALDSPQGPQTLDLRTLPSSTPDRPPQ